MSPQDYYNTYQGQSLLYNQHDASLRGQCVQSVCFFVVNNGFPVIWANAAEWWYSGQYSDRYERIANSANAVPQPGDIIVWDRNLPNSGGAGHIAVCLAPRPGTGSFISVDSNWGGKTVHQVTHNYSYVVGWLRMKRPTPPAPPQPVSTQTQGDFEMITNTDQATKMYKLLRPNGEPSQDEIDGTAGKRSYAQFVNDGQNEVAARDANLRDQAQRLGDLSTTINNQNLAITDITLKLSDATTTGSDKQKALNDALTQLTATNAELTTTHDQIKELQTKLSILGRPILAKPFAPKATWVLKLVAFLSTLTNKKG